MLTYKLFDDHEYILTIQADSRQQAKEQLENLGRLICKYDAFREDIEGGPSCWTLLLHSIPALPNKKLMLIEQEF